MRKTIIDKNIYLPYNKNVETQDGCRRRLTSFCLSNLFIDKFQLIGFFIAYFCAIIPLKSYGGIIMAQRKTGKPLLEKRIDDVDRKLKNAEKSVRLYKQQKAELEKELNAMKIKELSELMDQKGLSIDDVRSLIDGKTVVEETTEE